MLIYNQQSMMIFGETLPACCCTAFASSNQLTALDLVSAGVSLDNLRKECGS